MKTLLTYTTLAIISLALAFVIYKRMANEPILPEENLQSEDSKAIYEIMEGKG